MARLFSALGVRLGTAGDLGTALVGGIVEASTRLRDHAALHFLVEHEPGMILGHLAFDESDRLLATASRFTAPFLARWMSPDEAEPGRRVGRPDRPVVRHLAIRPTRPLRRRPTPPRLVTTFMLPGIEALRTSTAPSPSTSPRIPGDPAAEGGASTALTGSSASGPDRPNHPDPRSTPPTTPQGGHEHDAPR